jgi:hypothetical protein
MGGGEKRSSSLHGRSVVWIISNTAFSSILPTACPFTALSTLPTLTHCTAAMEALPCPRCNESGSDAILGVGVLLYRSSAEQLMQQAREALGPQSESQSQCVTRFALARRWPAAAVPVGREPRFVRARPLRRSNYGPEQCPGCDSDLALRFCFSGPSRGSRNRITVGFCVIMHHGQVPSTVLEYRMQPPRPSAKHCTTVIKITSLHEEPWPSTHAGHPDRSTRRPPHHRVRRAARGCRP